MPSPLSFNAGAGFCRGSSTSQSTPHKRVKGYSYFKSNKAHNKLQHSLNGNTTLRLAMCQDQVYPKLELSLHHLIPISPPTIPRSALLKLRPNPSTVEEVLPKLVSSRDPRLVFKGSAQKASPQRGGNGQQPDQSTPPSSKQKHRRTGRRIRFIDPQGTIRFRKACARSRPHRNSIIHKNSLVKGRVPPPRGMPGAPFGASKEYTPPKRRAQCKRQEPRQGEGPTGLPQVAGRVQQIHVNGGGLPINCPTFVHKSHSTESGMVQEGYALARS